MSERKLKTPALEISMHSPQPDYAQILEQLYHLRQDTELTNEEKTAKLQSILHAMLQENPQSRDNAPGVDSSSDAQENKQTEIKDDPDAAE